jgi:hypothetical protein
MAFLVPPRSVGTISKGLTHNLNPLIPLIPVLFFYVATLVAFLRGSHIKTLSTGIDGIREFVCEFVRFMVGALLKPKKSDSRLI